jgi:glucuronokinase
MSEVSGGRGAPAVDGRAFARAGLLGNPSDGYGGRTISLIMRNFEAVVSLRESSDLRIEPREEDHDAYRDIDHLTDTIARQGYYGGTRLIKAAIKTFLDHCRDRGIELERTRFTARYRSTIPRQVGLAGSSAIITAALRALMAFHEVDIPREEQPGLILSAEWDELRIAAGLQDRVIQVYGGLVYMDFSPDVVAAGGRGRYEELDPGLLPPLFVAYRTGPEKVSGRVLNALRFRWDLGDEEVIASLNRIADIAAEGRDALLAGDIARLGELMDENFDLRSGIMEISEVSRKMIDRARALGVPAKFTGSGGAIIGICRDDETFIRIRETMEPLGVVVVRPRVTAEDRP